MYKLGAFMLALLGQQGLAAAQAPADNIAKPLLVPSDYERALTIRPGYARALLGLAEVEFQAAGPTQDCDPSRVDAALVPPPMSFLIR